MYSDYSMPCAGGDCMGSEPEYSMNMHYGSEPEYSMDMHYDWSEPEMPMYSFLKYDPAMMSTHSMPCAGGDCLGYSMSPCTGADCMGFSDYSMPEMDMHYGSEHEYSMDMHYGSEPEYSMNMHYGSEPEYSMDMHYDWSEPEMPMYSFLKYDPAMMSTHSMPEMDMHYGSEPEYSMDMHYGSEPEYSMDMH